MKKVFTKVSGFVLAASLLCSTVPAMALGFKDLSAKVGVKTATAEVAKGAVKSTPGFMSRVYAAWPTWKGTKALAARMANSNASKAVTAAVIKTAQTVSTTAKKVACTLNNHRLATMGALAASAAIYGGYKVTKAWKAARIKAQLHNACVNATNVLTSTVRAAGSFDDKCVAIIAEFQKVRSIQCEGSLEATKNAFLAEYEIQAERTLSHNQALSITELDRIIATLAPQVRTQKTVSSNAAAGATATEQAPITKAAKPTPATAPAATPIVVQVVPATQVAPVTAPVVPAPRTQVAVPATQVAPVTAPATRTNHGASRQPQHQVQAVDDAQADQLLQSLVADYKLSHPRATDDEALAHVLDSQLNGAH